MTLASFLAETRELVDAALDRFLPSVDDEPCRLHAAMRYSVLGGGKRLRPAIARAACRAAGGTDGDVLPAACALEMLHTYSLIHDDLPALDDDALRRGQPTCHREFDEATAILAGDALQTLAFDVLARHTPRASARTPLVLALAEAAGTRGMVGGEIADLEAEGRTPKKDLVEWIHGRKTAALFRAAACMGGLSAGGGEAVLDALGRYGEALGLAFQIVDDVLDETSDAQTLGKGAGKDRVTGKMSYPAAVGLDASRDRARALAEEAKRAVDDLGAGQRLADLAEFAITRLK